MATIADIVAAGKEFGVFDFYLPFIIMFSIIFGILMKTSIFGSPKDAGVRRLNLILAGAFSLFVMIYTPVGITLAGFLSSLFAEALIVIVTIVAIMMIFYLLFPLIGIKMELKSGVKFLVIIIILIGIGIFISSGGLAFFPGLTFGEISGVPNIIVPSIGLSSQDLALIVLGLLTLVAFWWIVKGEGGSKGENVKYVPVPVKE